MRFGFDPRGEKKINQIIFSDYTVPALDVDFDEVRLTFETNLFGVMRMCQEFSSLLIRAKGTIVQIGSVAGIIPYVFGCEH